MEMLANRATVIGLLLSCGVVLAADEEIPEMDLIEYLGTWEESDEDWLLFNGPMTAENEQRSDPVPEGEESTEKDDES